MPEVKREKCPKGEHYDKKTKKCVKVKKSPPKKESPKKNNNTKKVSPKTSSKKNNTKKVSPARNIPKLAVLKSSMTDYEYKYFKLILGQIEEFDLEKGFVEGKRFRSSSFYKLDDIVEMIEEEIEYLKKTGCSGGPKHNEFCFGGDTKEKIIKQLHVYINYFKHTADSKGRVDWKDYAAL